MLATAPAAGADAPAKPALAASRPDTADSLVRALRAGGARVKFEQKIRQPFFPVPATILEVDRDTRAVSRYGDGWRRLPNRARTANRNRRSR